MKPYSLVAVLVVMIGGAACGHDDPGTAYAEVDCGRMTDHMIDVLAREGGGRGASEVQAARDKLVAQRQALVTGCLKDRPTRRLTERQYTCLLDAETTEAMSHCQ
ncbi:MAG: hypothetical protein K8W52_20140 [Deltaproteobacteria bacterium]|nr:hypothetical protein [Deltaproteobacteria bacterium]